MNYYQILGLKENCTIKDIKKAFRTLSKEYHPDINKDGESKFKDIKKAYDVLIDEDKRNEYNDSGYINSSIDMNGEIDAFIVDYLFEEILNNSNQFDEFIRKSKTDKQDYLNQICNYHVKDQKRFLAKKTEENLRRKLICLELNSKDSCITYYEKIIEMNTKLIIETNEQIKFLELAKKRINQLIN
tara:strand:- start:374 stop:931 length:558 start_codon:yes stop_codon:yes gene_type:complete